MKSGKLVITLSRIITTVVGIAFIFVGIIIATIGLGNLLIISTLPFFAGGWLIWNGGIKGKFIISKGPMLLGFILLLPVIFVAVTVFLLLK